MNKLILGSCALLATGLASFSVQAQSGAAAGATTGAVGGAIVGGPVGAVVGAAGGAIIGGIAEDKRPQFRTYVTNQHVPSYRYSEDVRVGAVLPESGVTYYDVPGSDRDGYEPTC